jgi:putative transposase
MIERQGPLSLSRQCELLGLSRAALYYRAVKTGACELELMALIDRQYLQTPFYGSRRMAAWLQAQGHAVNRKRVQRLMLRMGLAAIYQRPRTSRPAPEHRIYPYLLRGLRIERVGQVGAADITYIPWRGFLYLVAVMDWVSRYVLAWRLSNLLDASFCIEALEDALSQGRPEIFNTDQGSQFTDDDFTGVLRAHGVAISMDGRGRLADNIFVERLWRSLKYEEVYLKAYENVTEARQGIAPTSSSTTTNGYTRRWVTAPRAKCSSKPLISAVPRGEKRWRTPNTISTMRCNPGRISYLTITRSLSRRSGPPQSSVALRQVPPAWVSSGVASFLREIRRSSIRQC